MLIPTKSYPVAKRKLPPPKETGRCEYCVNNLGENKKFGHMWHCRFLEHCTIWTGRCQAKEKGKGDFEKDEAKHQQWISKKAA